MFKRGKDILSDILIPIFKLYIIIISNIYFYFSIMYIYRFFHCNFNNQQYN